MPTIKVQGRLSFEHVFRPDSSNGAPAYSATILVPQGDPQVKMIKDAIVQTATDKWKDKAPGILKGLIPEGKTCLRNGDTKTYDGYAGMMYITARNKIPPTVVDRKCDRLTEADGVIYSGCYVIAHIELWAQDNTSGKRVNGKLLGLQFVKDGDRFGAGSGPSKATDFSVLPDEEDEKTAAPGGNPWD